MLTSLSNLSILLQNGQFPIFSLFWQPFFYHTNDKSQSNMRLLHFVYRSNKLVRTNWRKTNLRAPPTSWWSSTVFGLSVCPSVCLSVCYCGHSNLVILNRISSKFHILIASIKLWFKFRYGFLSTIDNQDV